MSLMEPMGIERPAAISNMPLSVSILLMIPGSCAIVAPAFSAVFYKISNGNSRLFFLFQNNISQFPDSVFQLRFQIVPYLHLSVLQSPG